RSSSAYFPGATGDRQLAQGLTPDSPEKMGLDRDSGRVIPFPEPYEAIDMNELAQRRLAISEARFDTYDFGHEVEEVHHWHATGQGDEYCRTILFCGDAPGAPSVRGHFLVRFLPNRPVVDACDAMIDGCLIGRDTA